MREKELLETGYKKYTGEKIDVFYNKDICTHAGECVKGNGDVFEVGRRPWVMPDAAEANEVAEVIDRCPSKALQYITK